MSIIRLSGSDATGIARKVFRPAGNFRFNWEPRDHQVGGHEGGGARGQGLPGGGEGEGLGGGACEGEDDTARWGGIGGGTRRVCLCLE